MNRLKREEASEHKAIREGMSPLVIKRLDRGLSLNRQIFDLARQIHIEFNPEEYCHIFDDHVDHAIRRNGINPMSNEYISLVAHKRAEQGVAPLDESGAPTSSDTWEACLREAEAIVRG